MLVLVHIKIIENNCLLFVTFLCSEVAWVVGYYTPKNYIKFIYTISGWLPKMVNSCFLKRK